MKEEIEGAEQRVETEERGR
jgi:hypothetical protein